MAGLIAGCSGVPAIPTSSAPSGAAYNAAAGLSPAAATKCHVTQTMKEGGGWIHLPSCDGFSGRMEYPKSYVPGISVTVTVSAKPLPHVYYKDPNTVYYMEWVFTGGGYSKGSTINFYSTVTGPSDGSKIKGPFNPKSSYWAVFQDPNSTDPKPHGGITISGTTKGHAVLGIPFPGTDVLAGAKNFVLFTSKNP